ncbi:MAG: hypothetical protein IKZ16_08200, partial [Clostridia bacterium]|nr:hypothetical protein [Clostridia bacterium]
MTKRCILIPLLCVLTLLSSFTAFAETPPAEGSGLIITEICYNPQWKEGDESLESTTDMFPYTEIYNATGKEISLEDISLTYRSDAAGTLDSGKLLCAGDAPV